MQPTILVVDDIALNCEVITLALQTRGYNVVSALDGIEGIKAAQQHLPDTILLDVMMPILNGFETCRRLKELPETSTIPVIMMTALSDTGSKVKAFEAGAADYIAKPLDVDEMLMRVQSQVRLYRLTHDLEQKNHQLQQAVAALENAQEQLIQQNQERLQMILNATGTGTWEWDFTANRVRWSGSIAAILNATTEAEITYQDYLALVHPDDRDHLQRAIQRIVDDPNQLYHIEHRITSKDGELYWIEGKGKVFFDDQHQPISFMGTVVDITERKRAEEALRQSEERFAKAFHVNPSGVAISRTSERVVLDANQQMLDILGFERDEFLTPGAVDIWVDADQQKDFLHRAQRDGNLLSEQVQFRRRDGRIIDAEATVSFFEQDGEQYWITMVQDVTERKQAERSLLEREETARQFQEKLRALIEVSMILSDMQTLDDLYREIVVLGRSMLGFDRLALFLLDETNEHILGTFGTDTEGNLRDERHLRRRLTEANGITEIIASGERVHCWHDTPLRDQWQDVARGWNALAVVWDGDKAVGYMPTDNLIRGEALLPYQLDLLMLYGTVVGYLITRQRLYERINRHARELEGLVAERTAQLEAKANELEAFTYSVSHDLRAPLRAMHGFSNSLLQHYNAHLPEKAQHYVTRIHQNAHRMGLLIDDLLELSRVGRKELRKQTVSVTTLVAEILHELSADQQLGTAQIIVGDVPPCQADPTLLKQVLVNLITNAIKYSRNTPQPIINIGSESNQQETVYYIKDNGVGFDMEYADKLFGVFQRLHSEQEYEGTGIGLATVYRILDRHGGRVWAEAAVNQGASFYFVLPQE